MVERSVENAGVGGSIPPLGATHPKPFTNLHCTFCGKNQAQVHKLVAGSIGFICDECVLLCYEIMVNEKVPGFGNPA